MLPYLQKNEQQGHEGPRMQTLGRGDLQHEQLFAQGRHRHFRRRMHGEIVSPDGLLFTNHHCGYGSIQSLSSVEHDYLKNGFWAMSRAEELPAPGLKVRFIRRIVDVTPDVWAPCPTSPAARSVRVWSQNMRRPLEEPPRRRRTPVWRCRDEALLRRQPVFAFVIEVFRDVGWSARPPTSIGKFGGDTDNWMWPRHTGAILGLPGLCRTGQQAG